MGNIITKSNIESQTYSNILEIVDDRSNIVDPKRKNMDNAQKREFVYEKDPFEGKINFDDLPYIILEIPKVTDDDDSQSLDATKQDIFWTHKLVVRTKRDNSSNVLTDRGRTDMLAICDDLHETFNSRSIKDTFRGYNIHNLRIVKSDTSNYQMNNSIDIFESEFELTYNTRLTVSD